MENLKEFKLRIKNNTNDNIPNVALVFNNELANTDERVSVTSETEGMSCMDIVEYMRGKLVVCDTLELESKSTLLQLYQPYWIAYAFENGEEFYKPHTPFLSPDSDPQTKVFTHKKIGLRINPDKYKTTLGFINILPSAELIVSFVIYDESGAILNLDEMYWRDVKHKLTKKKSFEISDLMPPYSIAIENTSDKKIDEFCVLEPRHWWDGESKFNDYMLQLKEEGLTIRFCNDESVGSYFKFKSGIALNPFVVVLTQIESDNEAQLSEKIFCVTLDANGGRVKWIINNDYRIINRQMCNIATGYNLDGLTKLCFTLHPHTKMKINIYRAV